MKLTERTVKKIEKEIKASRVYLVRMKTEFDSGERYSIVVGVFKSKKDAKQAIWDIQKEHYIVDKDFNIMEMYIGYNRIV